MRTRVALALLLLGTAAWGQVPESVDSSQIPNYRVLRPGLAVGGKPSAEALAKLKAQGFKTVIDLRAVSEGTADEKQAVEAQGLRYVAVPITAATFSPADALAVAKVLDEAEAAPVLLHCATSNRVGAVWAVLQVRKGRDVTEAEAAGREAGLSSPAMIEAFKRVAEDLAPRNSVPAP